MQFKRAIAATVALCAPAAPAVALAASGHHPKPVKPKVAHVSQARLHHLALHRKAASRNLRLSRLLAKRSGHAMAASLRSTVNTLSLDDLQRSNEHLRAELDALRRDTALVVLYRSALQAIAHCESHGNPDAVSSTGRYRGMFQFDMTAWRAAGGHGDPAEASAREQYVRAAITYKRRGPEPWPICGRRV